MTHPRPWTKASYSYFNSNPFSGVIWTMYGLWEYSYDSRCMVVAIMLTGLYRDYDDLFGVLHLCNRDIFIFDLDSDFVFWSSTIWSTFIWWISSPRNYLRVQYMRLGQQLRHCKRTSYRWCQSLWVFSFAHRFFKYWPIDILQTAHNLDSTSVSTWEISDLPPQISPPHLI